MPSRRSHRRHRGPRWGISVLLALSLVPLPLPAFDARGGGDHAGPSRSAALWHWSWVIPVWGLSDSADGADDLDPDTDAQEVPAPAWDEAPHFLPGPCARPVVRAVHRPLPVRLLARDADPARVPGGSVARGGFSTSLPPAPPSAVCALLQRWAC